MAENIRIDLRDKRLRPSGRISVSSGTTNAKLAKARKASLLKVLERGDVEVIEALRSGQLHVSEIDRAVRDGDYDGLRKLAATPRVTVKEAVAIAQKEVATNREPRTQESYADFGRILTARFEPNGTPRQLATITTEEIKDFLHGVQARGEKWQEGTKRQAFQICRRIWKLAGVATDAWDEIELLPARTTRHVFLQPEEWNAVIAANDRLPVASVLGLGCLAGLRIGEISHLRSGVDVDLEKRVIRVQPRKAPIPWKTKTERSVRDVPINEELYGLLRFHADNYAGARYFVRIAGRDEPVSEDVLGRRWIRSAMKRGGLVYGRNANGYTAHTLRHTFASWLAQRDVQLLKIAALLGDTPETVARVYAHLTPRDLDRAVSVVDSVVRDARREATATKTATGEE